jgi:hypothetical protein
VRGEHDALDAGPDESHLVEQGQVFFDGGAWAGDGDGEGPCTHVLQSEDGSGRELNGDTRSGEEICDGVSDRIVASDDEDPTHRNSWRVTRCFWFVLEKALGIDDRRSRMVYDHLVVATGEFMDRPQDELDS